MTKISRRGLLASAAVLPLLGACAEIKQYLTPQWVQDIQVIADDVAKLLPATVTAQVREWVSRLGSLAGQIAAAVQSGGTPAMLLQQFVDVLVGIAGSGTLSGSWGQVIQAAMALLPTILRLAGVAISFAAPRGPAVMTPEQARAILYSVR